MITTEAERRRNRKWAAANPDRMRAYARKSARKARGCQAPTRPEPKVCECCGQPETTALCADHDHKTGKFRGWLCKRCNTAIGLLFDSLYGALCAVDYLLDRLT